MRARSVVIGFIDLPRPVVMRTSYETAAWHTDALIPAGRYLLEECRDQYGKKYWAADFSGVIVYEYMPSLWGGVPIGKSPQGDQHPNVGRRHVVGKWWNDFAFSYYFASEVARTGAFTFYDEKTREPVACPVTFFVHEAAVDYRYFSCSSDSHYTPRPDGSASVARGMRGHWVDRFEVRPRLLLSAGEVRS